MLQQGAARQVLPCDYEPEEGDHSMSRITTNTSVSAKLIVASLFASALIAAVIASAAWFLKPSPRIAYVDTAKLMVGFSEASRVQNELKAKDEKWRKQLAVLQDSVQAAIDTMSRYFDKASPARKKALQDNLSAWNQRANNFRHANEKRMGKMREEKMKGVTDKVNVYLQEFGKKHGYSILFGTVAGGSILYGDPDRYDVTDDVVAGLNERYR